MLTVYPFGAGSLYTASYAVSASCAVSASFINTVVSAVTAGTVLFPQTGARGKSVCVISYAEYLTLQARKNEGYVEICNV